MPEIHTLRQKEAFRHSAGYSSRLPVSPISAGAQTLLRANILLSTPALYREDNIKMGLKMKWLCRCSLQLTERMTHLGLQSAR